MASKPKARNAGYRVEIYDSIEAATSLDRNGLIDVQNFDTPLTGLKGLEALDAGQSFDDLELVEAPCYIVIRKNRGHVAAQARKVTTRKLGGPVAAEEHGAEEVPF